MTLKEENALLKEENALLRKNENEITPKLECVIPEIFNSKSHDHVSKSQIESLRRLLLTEQNN